MNNQQIASHILVICTANICRSPVAEAVLRQRLQEQGLAGWTVSSAGTWAESERSAATHSIQIMAEKGVDLRPHRSRIVTEEMLAEVDLVLCMEIGHVEALHAEFPAHSRKIYLLSEMVGQRYSVSDPYGGPLQEYQRMVKELTNLIDKGLPRIITLAGNEQVYLTR